MRAFLRIVLIFVGFGLGQLSAQPQPVATTAEEPTNAELAEEIRKLRIDYQLLQADAQVIRTETEQAVGFSQSAQFAATEAINHADESLTNDYRMQSALNEMANRIYTKCIIKVPGMKIPDTACELLK